MSCMATRRNSLRIVCSGVPIMISGTKELKAATVAATGSHWGILSSPIQDAAIIKYIVQAKKYAKSIAKYITP